MMETAISKSIENNKDSIVSSLYPVVGSLVRKSVSVFFEGFLEKLNQLIEYSLTIKGIKWRFAAWRQGIPFAQYVIKQSFVYRVEDVMLIHRPTGNLLIDIASEHSECNDPELMSAMLTAINDFMSDSFSHNDDVVLDTIKTKELTLVIASGPHALLVAAVSGNAPHDIQQQLQQTLEEIHGLLLPDLQSYEGENSAFIAVEPHLRSCLVSELNSANEKKKKPLWSILVLIVVMVFAGFQFFTYWQQQRLLESIVNAPKQAGILVQNIKWNDNTLVVDVLRDPHAISPQLWLRNNAISTSRVEFNQIPYASLEHTIVDSKIKKVLENTDISSIVENGIVYLSGNSALPLTLEQQAKLVAIPGVASIDSSALVTTKLNSQTATQKKNWLLEQQIAKLSSQFITFTVKSAEVTDTMQTKLNIIAKRLATITTLAQDLGIGYGVIISGYSDQVGNLVSNKLLSENRALAVKNALINSGVESDVLFAVGVGEVNLPNLGNASRKVLFSVIHQAEITNKEQLVRDSLTLKKSNTGEAK